MISKETYSSKYDEIYALNITRGKKISVFILALLIGLLVISGPICLAINLMIYNDLRKLMATVIILSIILLVFLVDMIYLKGITEGQVKNLKIIYITDTLAFSVVILLLGLIIIKLGVV